MDNIKIGIDFGTTNTSVAYMKYNNISSIFSPECFELDNGVIMRSAITYMDDNNFWIGDDALRNSYKYPNQYIDSLKRQVVNDTLKHKCFGSKVESDILADFFSSVMDRIKLQIPYGCVVDGVAIGVPIGFRDRDKELYIQSLIKSGIYEDYGTASRNTMFVSEPIAAVLNYNVSLRDDKRVLVFDFGGGTLDLVIMDMNNIRRSNEISMHDVISKKGKLNLGGNDFDRAILEDIVVEKYGMTNLKKSLGINQLIDILKVQEGIALMNEIRRAKEELSKYEFTTIAFEKGNLKMNLEVTREEYEYAINSYLKTIENLVDECLSYAGLTPNDIDIVVLSGGSSLTPAVQKLLFDIFGVHKVKIDPGNTMTCISRGLALRAHDPGANRYNDILEHSYGVIMKDKQGNNTIIRKVLERGMKIKDINDKDYYREFVLIKEAKDKNIFIVKICEDSEEIGKARIKLTDEMINSKFKLYFTIDENKERLELHIYDLKWKRKVEVPLEYRYIEISK